tara:strand:- start:35 stop:445 length:411 start_codon:yes stop_codon:yes gene_type:complete
MTKRDREASHVDFDWDAVDDGAADVERLSSEKAAHAIAYLFAFIFSPEGTSLVKAFRRFVALTYVLRPDLIQGRTIRSIADELGQGKTTFGRFVTTIRTELGVDGVLVRHRPRQKNDDDDDDGAAATGVPTAGGRR